MKNFTQYTTKDGRFTYYKSVESVAKRLVPHLTPDKQFLYYTVTPEDDGKNHSQIKPSAFTQR